MKYPGDISPEAYAAMEEGYDQGRTDGRRELADLQARLRLLVQSWESMAGPANSVYETCARDLRGVLDRRGSVGAD